MGGVGFYSLFVSFEGKLQVIVCFAYQFHCEGQLYYLPYPGSVK
jgi:hypothetical protein